MTPLTGTALEKRIAELEQERDELLRTTENIKYAHISEHGRIRKRYNAKINNLRKYGIEWITQLSDVNEKRQITNKAKYGYAGGNIQQSIKTKLDKGIGIFGDRAAALTTKRKRYGNALGDLNKLQQTKLERYGDAHYSNKAKAKQTCKERYGYAHWNVAKGIQVKRQKYGNGRGRPEAAIATNLQRYGVPWFCMTNKCRQANHKVISRANVWWHNKLLQELQIEFAYDDVKLDTYSYDLHFEHVLIEVNPSFSHNSTYSFAYLTGIKQSNKPYSTQYHFNKTQLALKHGYTCITIFEWMDDNEVIDVIRKHLAGEPVDSTDLALNPQLSDDKSTIRKHWCHLKTKEHIEDCGQNEQEMIDAGYVVVYDCGHAKQLIDDCNHAKLLAYDCGHAR